MHIALVMNSAYGVRTLRSDLLRFLIGINHEVTVLCPLDDPVAQSVHVGVRFLDWEVSRSGANPVRESFAVLRLARLFRHVQPDIILNFTPKAVVYGSLAARLSRQKNVFGVLAGLGFLFGTERALVRLLSPMIRIAFRLLLRNNRTVFFQNPDDMRYFVRSKIVQSNRAVRLNGSGVNLRHFRPNFARGDSTETVFLMVGRLIVPKGVVEYLTAARTLLDERLKVRFGLLGPHYSHPTALDPEFLRTYERPGEIDYLGVTDDVRPFLRSCDVFVLPSYYGEGTPRSALEAMAMGKPIITTDSPGCRETVIHGKNGFLVPIRDPSALADAMRRLVGNREERDRMGRFSRRLAESQFDVNAVNEYLWTNILQSLDLQ